MRYGNEAQHTALVGVIRRLAAERDMSERQVARAAQIDPSTLNRKLKGVGHLTYPEVARLAVVFGIQPSDLSLAVEAEVA